MLTKSNKIAAECLQAALAAVTQAEDELGRLDAVAGDGDHGAGMVRGFQAAVTSIADIPTGELLVNAGLYFADAAGGSSGALVGMFIQTLGRNLHGERISTIQVHEALVAGLVVMCKLGRTRPGDKTMIDTLDPFIRAFGEVAGQATVAQAWAYALPAAEEGMKATAEMVSKRGRSALLKDKSLGHLDPGAVSAYYVLSAASAVLQQNYR